MAVSNLNFLTTAPSLPVVLRPRATDQHRHHPSIPIDINDRGRSFAASSGLHSKTAVGGLIPSASSARLCATSAMAFLAARHLCDPQACHARPELVYNINNSHSGLLRGHRRSLFDWQELIWAARNIHPQLRWLCSKTQVRFRQQGSIRWFHAWSQRLLPFICPSRLDNRGLRIPKMVVGK